MQGQLSLTGSRLQFDRSGRHLILADNDRVSVIDGAATTERRTVYAARSSVRALAAFDDQVWLVDDNVLRRIDIDGREVGEPFEITPGFDADWSPAPCGPAGVVVPTQPNVSIVDDLGVLAVLAHPEADLLVPITARRAIAISGSKVHVRPGVTLGIGANVRVLGGIVVADGKSLVLATVGGTQQRLVTIALGADQITAQHTIAADEVRIASRRAVAALRTTPHRIRLIDLRFGRELGSLVIDDEIDDLAIDPDARSIAVRSGDKIELVEIASLLLESRTVRARGTMPPASIFAREQPEPTSEQPAQEAVAEPQAPAQPPEPPVAEPAPSDARFDQPLVALAPRRVGAGLPRAAALACLEVERRVVLARTRIEIAKGWDTRRLGYANESRHPFEREVGALLGTERGHALRLVENARRQLDTALAERTADRAQHGEASPLGELAHELALTPLELDILIAVAAPTLWGETARLYGVLGNDPGRAIVDEMLVGQLLAETNDRYEIAAALGPEATLRRHAIVVATGERPRPFTTLAINPIVAARLRCESAPLPDAVRVYEARTALENLVVPVEATGRVLRYLARSHARPVRLVVRGRRSSGRRSVLAGIAARARRVLGIIDLAASDGAELRRCLRAANLCGLVPCVVGSPREGVQRAITDVLAAHAGPVFAVLGTDEPSPFPAGHVELVLPPLSAADRFEHWRRTLDKRGLRVADPELLSSRYRLAPGLVCTAAEHVATSNEHDDADVTLALVAAIRQTRDERLARHATRITRLPRWSDVVLPPDVLDTLRELIGRVRHGRRVYEEWGFDAVMTTGRGLTALFDGRPGTGKTMVAGVIARELGLDLYRVDLSRLVSKWIGETEKNLAEIFDAVDDGQAIILFDEADSLFGKRTEVKSSNDRYANLEVNYLLQRIDSFEGIAILTTNFGTAIDPAFRRRVSLRLSFPFPDEDAREQLWRVHLPSRLPIAGDLDLAALARRFQLAGGYIRNACLRAAFLAAQEETTLTQQHLERAVHLEYQQVGKLSTTGPVD
jgi:hypothetical protein